MKQSKARVSCWLPQSVAGLPENSDSAPWCSRTISRSTSSGFCHGDRPNMAPTRLPVRRSLRCACHSGLRCCCCTIILFLLPRYVRGFFWLSEWQIFIVQIRHRRLWRGRWRYRCRCRCVCRCFACADGLHPVSGLGLVLCLPHAKLQHHGAVGDGAQTHVAGLAFTRLLHCSK